MNYKILITLLASGMAHTTCQVTPTFIARSQSLDGTRKLVGVAEKVHVYDAAWYFNNEGFYFNLSAMPEYTQSTKGSKIAQSLFGNDLLNCNKILIQGTEVANRDPRAWLADYFYLAPDYDSYFTINPRIRNILVDLDLYVGLDNLCNGLYLRLHGPITWTKWDIGFSEPCDIVTTGSYAPGYFNATQVRIVSNNFNGMKNNQLLQTFGAYAAGGHPLHTPGGYSFPRIASGTAFGGLNYAKITPCAQTRTGFADLRGELGWNFLQCDNYHLGINFQIAAPTGSKRQAQYSFDAVVGNGNHWEVGGGLTAHYIFWRSQSDDKHIGFYADVSITHLNKAREQRTFDLCGKPNSRYMLAQKMSSQSVQNDVSFVFSELAGPIVTTASTASVSSFVASPLSQQLAGLTPIATFDNFFTPVANLTTLDVNVGIAVQADVAAMMSFTADKWEIDLGYNFYGRSCERIRRVDNSVDQCCPNLCSSKDQWALKGDAHVYSFNGFIACPLSATECNATIHRGTNATTTNPCLGVATNVNCGIDDSQFAYLLGQSGMNISNVFSFFLPTPQISPIPANQIKTSLQPKFINCCDINFQETKGISNKIFGHISYTWKDITWMPYLGVGGFGEFGGNSACDSGCEIIPDCSTPCDTTSCQKQCCSDCLKSSLSQWGVWLKGGLTFN